LYYNRELRIRKDSSNKSERLFVVPDIWGFIEMRSVAPDIWGSAETRFE
jgi:hypothetical protein